ncbi:hypothetical protein CHS0354_009603 [Potamilus streckersoni]|uniref:protein-tyrosine-phosphatase n=1 Tax=Potamilus streckersoni TaxID=2493646 RepID=A0AAE0VZ87_9BIVA|nr:hypothetical protein CHS0354_009603 [Potamilus streckersoni]
MPCCRCSVRMSVEDCISPEKLKDELLTGDSLLVLDCRSQAEFSRCHVKGAINVTLPSLMLRRLKAGKLTVACIFQNNEAKDKFQSLSKTRLIVLYDDSDAAPQGNPSSVVALLYKKLKQEGCRPSFLEGGYPFFKEQYPEFCVSQEPSSGNTDEILGLCNLKISEDSAYGTSDSDNDNQFSPSSNFPVEVMPYLYLGNAKNSADLNQLKKCGITYILNVTPNVPNMFENDKNFKYMKIPINDHLSQNLLKFFPDAITFIVSKFAVSFHGAFELHSKPKTVDAVFNSQKCCHQKYR